MTKMMAKRMRRVGQGFILFLLIGTAIEATALAQNGFDKGTPAESKSGLAGISTYAQDKIETVNLANGNLTAQIPLVSIGGRGGVSYTIALSYNSKLWTGQHDAEVITDPFGGSITHHHFAITYDDNVNTKANMLPLGSGWMIGLGPAVKVRPVNMDPLQPAECPGIQGSTQYKYVLTKVWIVLPDGSEVEMRDDATEGAPYKLPNPCNSSTDRDRGRVWHSVDGSAITYITDANNGVVSGELTGWVYLADGTRLRMNAGSLGGNFGGAAACSKIFDRQGNVLDFMYNTPVGGVTYTDQMGRQVILQATASGASVTIKGYNGLSDRVITVATNQLGAQVGGNYVNFRSDINVQHPIYNGDMVFDFNGNIFHADANPHTDLFQADDQSTWSDSYVGFTELDLEPAVTQLNLLDGRVFKFRYNQYGELAEIVYPNGGVSRINYDDYGLGMCEGGQLRGKSNRRVIERKVFDDGNAAGNPSVVWSYSRVPINPAPQEYVQVEVRRGSDNALLMSEKHYYLALEAEYRTCLLQSFASNGTANEKWESGKEFRVERQVGGGFMQVETRDWLQRATVTWANDPGLGYNDYAGQHGQEQPSNDTRVSEENTILESNRKKRLKYSYSNDKFNNVIKIEEYDLGVAGANPPGDLLRTTERTYATAINGYCYSNLDGLSSTCSSGVAADGNDIIHLRRLLETETVKNGAGVIEAYTEFEYDNYVPDAPLNTHAAIVNNSGMSGYNGNRFIHFTAANQPRGNVTQVKRWKDGAAPPNGNYVTSYTQYDNAGNVVKSIDPLLHATQISYADNFGNGSNPDTGSFTPPTGPTFAMPTLVTNAKGHQVKSQYDYTRGTVTGVKDANNTVTRSEYDVLDRPFRITAGYNKTGVEQTITEMSYPTATANESKVSKQFDDTRWLTSRTQYDGFGRALLSSQAEDGLKYDNPSINYSLHTKTIYDGLGRAKFVTNPYRGSGGDTTDGWTRTTYDQAGRVIEVTTFPGSPSTPPPDSGTTNSTGSVLTTYNGEQTTVTDQAGKKRRSIIDGLGRLIQVDELLMNGNLYASTTYGYDGRGNLKTVTQSPQPARQFSYDGLSRLTQAINPESGTVNYDYYANSNLFHKTDARAVTTTFTYDEIDRLTVKDYSDSTPDVSYSYDTATNGVGSLASVTANGVSTTNYAAYDALGRLTSYNQVTAGQPYPFINTYNKSGMGISERYPSNKVIETEYDAAGRVAGVKKGTSYYAGAAASDATNRLQYTAHGAVLKVKLGNGLWEHTNFNDRLQPTQIGLGSAASNSSVLQMDFEYGASNQNNGNLSRQTITAPKTAGGNLVLVQNYSYDDLNRLSQATETVSGTQQWQQIYDIDRFGNRAVRSTSYIPNPQLTPQSASATDFSAFNQGNNRIQRAGFDYDQVGNLKSDPVAGANAMVYDGENRLKSYTKAGVATTYEYDGDGKRVKKVEGTNTTVLVYNASGQLIAEYTTAAPQPQAGGGVSYFTQDHLGSTRVVTGASGNVKSRRDYLPFGEELGASVGGRNLVSGYGVNDGQRKRFTGQQHDDESGMDYFIARYYSAAQGRFTSPDEFAGGPDEFYELGSGDSEKQALVYADIFQPQSLNKYQYCYNNPLRYVDLNGNWPTPIHRQIIQEAFPGLSSSQINIMVKAGARVDKDQTMAGAYKHSMRAPNQPIDKAKEKTAEFISVGEEEAKQFQREFKELGGKGFSKDALDSAGEAIHAVTDATSPAHTDGQGNPRVWDMSGGTGRKLIVAGMHAIKESKISPEEMKEAVNAAHQEFGKIFGEAALKQATTDPKSKTQNVPVKRHDE